MTTATQIWDEVHKGLRTFILKRVNNEAQAEDLLQEVFLRVHRELSQLKEPDRLISWVFQIARHVVIDHYRSAERRHERPSGLATDFTAEGKEGSIEQENGEAKYELANCLRPMVNRLSKEYREAITLVELDGLTHQEAASRLGLSVAGMKSRVQRGRRQLKQMLDDCCLIELDSRRGVADYRLRPDASCP
jgi:RNA polymerase sigma-70 factor (ECF subfamily)